MSVTLVAGISAIAAEMHVDGDVSGITKGFRFSLDNEVLEVSDFAPYERIAGKRVRPGTDPHRWLVNRGIWGTTSATHPAGSVAKGVASAFVAGANTSSPNPLALSSSTLTAQAGESAPSGAPTGYLPVAFHGEDLYVWDGSAWRGPYIEAD